ncbi:uncharacterized protein LOC131240806 [Magnolia sinica]|uniref:uncharacterized protein LOC131240806 n=1 Tax=Magnolia sinica TaxID=86752 RepID=UPI002658C439|nr:uncharacterized protein LOC131240806 [Magnolia sinica]
MCVSVLKHRVCYLLNEMQSRSPHAAFFSSLKLVEKRLASENNNNSNNNNNNKNPSQIPLTKSITTTSTVESLSSPIYLGYHQPYDNSSSSLRLLQDSQPPQEFLSHSIEFPQTAKDPTQPDDPNDEPITGTDDGDDIGRLMDLLGLSDCAHEGGNLKSTSCFCNGGFYSKVAGVKGPKCEKEMERLEGWIGYFLNDGGEKKEPLRLAHLLLGKAAVMDENGFGGIDFPATVEEFLYNDPPTA